MRVAAVEQGAGIAHVYGTAIDLRVGDLIDVVLDTAKLKLRTSYAVRQVIPHLNYVRLQTDCSMGSVLWFGKGAVLQRRSF